jgi:hypothetical protein
MPYYLAVKADEQKDEFLLLTQTPCTVPWKEKTTTISFADPRLTMKAEVNGSRNYPIYACESPSQVLYAISVWFDSATWNEIILLVPLLVGNARVMRDVMPNIKKMLMQSFASTIKPDPTFTVDQMFYAYITRRWVVTAHSSPGWKKLFVSNIDDSTNSLIRIAKHIISNPAHSDGGDKYKHLINETSDTAMARSEYDNNIEKYLTGLSEKPMKPHVEQFLGWVNANYSQMSTLAATQVFNMCVTVMSGRNNVSKESLIRRQKVVIPEYIQLGNMDTANINANLTFLCNIAQDSLFVEYMCGLLTCERYVFLLQNSKLMRHLVTCMKRNPIFTSIIAYAMSFAMFYVTQLEFAANSTATEGSPFVFAHDTICEFPQFNDPTPYVPLSVKHIDSHVPFRVPGARIPVRIPDIPARLNIALTRKTSRFDIVADIPWIDMSVILTGSRYANACWIGPRERDEYGGDYQRYISEYFGSSESELDELLSLVEHNDAPLLDILGRDFLADPSDQKPATTPTSVDRNENVSEEKKVPASPIAAGIQAAIDEVLSTSISAESLAKSLSDFALSAASSTISDIETKEHKTSSDTSGDDVKVAEVKEEKDGKEEPPLVVNNEAREIFMRMKYAKDLFGNHTDIDIGYVGPEENFDAAAVALVLHLRKFGKAVALRFQKPRSYTWVIVTSFLRYTIDFFHARDSALGLIVNYMTSYPRAWFDGVSHMCTADYVCARMSGINNRYIFTMNDPIYTMMKAARREDITILLNLNEEGMLRRWFEVNMPDVKLILGNVDPSNSFFGKVAARNGIHDNNKKPWIRDIPIMPKSRTVLTPWTTENAEPIQRPHGFLEPISGKKIKVADATVFSRYMAEIEEIAAENIVRRVNPVGM